MDKTICFDDVKEQLFADSDDLQVTAAISVKRPGVISGIESAMRIAEGLGLAAMSNLQEGMEVADRETIMILSGSAKAILTAEERVMGVMTKPSGVATAARDAVRAAAGKMDIVSGAVKKVPLELKTMLRHAVVSGGAKPRICDGPFLYLDKNYVRIFGSVALALKAAESFGDRAKVVQLRGEIAPIAQEALEACENGASVLMIDTGARSDIALVSSALCAAGLREKVRVAFAGDIKISDIKELLEEDVDILDIGREIIDAPMLDMSFDVIDIKRKSDSSSLRLDLLDKREIFIENIRIENVNLNTVADTVARVLSVDRKDILVIDVRPTHIALDLLSDNVDADNIAGKEKELLAELAKIEGFCVSDESYVHSNGVLGIISEDENTVREMLERSREISDRIGKAIGKRACVFPTGFELQQGMIEDTNSPYIAEMLRKAGFEVKVMNCLPDDAMQIANAIEDAFSDGYSLIVTSGGVGAEDKDKTVEAVLKVDPNAAAPYLAKYHKGSGRHVRDGIRIAVSDINGFRIVTLPGPNDEVRLGMDALLKHLDGDFNKYEVAQDIASVLRKKLGDLKHIHVREFHNEQKL